MVVVSYNRLAVRTVYDILHANRVVHLDIQPRHIIFPFRSEPVSDIHIDPDSDSNSDSDSDSDSHAYREPIDLDVVPTHPDVIVASTHLEPEPVGTESTRFDPSISLRPQSSSSFPHSLAQPTIVKSSSTQLPLPLPHLIDFDRAKMVRDNEGGKRMIEAERDLLRQLLHANESGVPSAS